MTTKGKQSEVGEERPTQKSIKDVDDIVDNVLGSPTAPKSTLPKEPEEDLGDAPEEEGLEKEPENEEDLEQPKETPKKDGEDTDEESEDVVPLSKHKKILEKLQRRIDQKTAEVESLKTAESQKTRTPEEKLQGLSTQELNELRENVQDAIIDAKVTAKTEGTDMSDRLTELRNLNRSIEENIKSAPSRFAQKQLSHLEDMTETVKDLDPQIVDRKGELWETAKRVYQRMPSLQRSETGQAEALAIAAEYYVEKKSFESGRERTSTLQRKVSTLQKKTSLDGKRHNADSEQVSRRALKDKAIRGTYDDKLAYVRNTLVPDEFLNIG